MLKKNYLLAYLSTLILLSTSWAGRAATGEKVWEIKYRTGNGILEMLLCRHGAKMTFHKDLVLMATEPNWHSSFYNTKLKRCYDLPVGKAAWEKDLAAAPYDFRNAAKTQGGTWCGAQVIERSIAIKKYSINHISDVLVKDFGAQGKRLELYETDSIAIPKQALEAVHAFFAINACTRSLSLPLGLKVVQNDGTDLWAFKLASIKQLDYDPRQFAKPHLAKAKTMAAVTMNDEQQEAMRDIAEQMDLGETFGTKNKKRESDQQK